MASTLSPNMNLIVPTIGVEPGPNYASDINASLSLIDSHDHTPGRGIQITPAGLNINTDLTMVDNSLTDVKSIVFEAQASTSALQELYVSPGAESPLTEDLWYRDGNGVAIQLTSGGTVNATIASIPGESYAAGTFFWKQGAGSTVPANFDIGSITIRPNTAATANGVRLTPNGGISSQYDLILPLLPAVNSFMALDNAGNITATVPISQGITASNIANATITDAQLTAALIQLLAPTGSMVAYGGVTAPTGWLACAGQSVLRATYPDLFAVIGASYGSVDGTHFTLPDTRGLFLRGATLGSVSGYDPDAASRTAANLGGSVGNNIGSFQTSVFASHSHSPVTNLHASGGTAGTVSLAETAGGSGAFITAAQTANASSSTIVTESAVGGSETRPINLYVNYIIKT